MIEYDSQAIRQFADGLCTRADRLIAEATAVLVAYSVLGALIGAAIGWALRRYVPGLGSQEELWPWLFLLGAVIGYAMGSQRASQLRQEASQLRLQAQTALCQVKIEENTRKV